MYIVFDILDVYSFYLNNIVDKRSPGVRDTGAFEGCFGQIAAACWGFAALGVRL
ncbi:hypothetical protein SPHFLASMR4Y_02646 [Sphingorhabdus sp. SMR4y]|nr:hypothetical protein SPHFLASMR4Y_02646 [Sphingorhabdus sp. SMR4y]